MSGCEGGIGGSEAEREVGTGVDEAGGKGGSRGRWFGGCPGDRACGRACLGMEVDRGRGWGCSSVLERVVGLTGARREGFWVLGWAGVVQGAWRRSCVEITDAGSHDGGIDSR